MREVQSLARGLEIIDILINSQTPQSVTQLAEALDVDKSTVSRLMRTLEGFGYAQRAKESRAYIPGKRLHSIGWQLTNRYALREMAKPYLNYLAAATNECAHIAMYSSGKALITDDVQPETSILRVVGNAGRLIYLHNTAVGKGLIAFGDFPLPEDLPQITPRTITNTDALRTELEKIREQGYALDDEENEPGVRCLASPVFDALGATVATIGISGPTVRLPYETVKNFGEIIKLAARELSCELGFEGMYPALNP